MSAQTTQGNPHWHSDMPQPPGTDKPPRGHGRGWLIGTVAAALVVAAGGAAAGAALTHSAPKPAPNANYVPAPGATAPAPAPDQYVRDIWNAGITARASWIDTTGHTLVADWQAGYSSAWTDANVLAPGGVYPYHYAIFDQVTEQDLGVQPPEESAAQSAPGASDDVAVVDQYLSDLNSGDYADAWNLGGDNLNGASGYYAWVAGYSTTSSMSWSVRDLGNGVAAVNLTADQTDGSTNIYSGTCTVSNGVIVSSNLPAL